jgi:hypothetical protein
MRNQAYSAAAAVVVPTPRFTSLSELRAHYAEVKRRLGAEPPRPLPSISRAPSVTPRPIWKIAPIVSRAWVSKARDILAEVCAKHGLTEPMVCGASRSPILVIARHEAFYRMRRETVLSATDIGAFMGGFHYSSVLHGAQSHAERLGRGIA